MPRHLPQKRKKMQTSHVLSFLRNICYSYIMFCYLKMYLCWNIFFFLLSCLFTFFPLVLTAYDFLYQFIFFSCNAVSFRLNFFCIHILVILLQIVIIFETLRDILFLIVLRKLQEDLWILKIPFILFWLHAYDWN